MDHPSIGVLGTLHAKRSAVEPLGGPHGVCIPRFRNLGHQSQNFLRGYLIWGGAGRRHPAIAHSSFFVFHASCEMLARYENSVTLDPQQKDAWGIPSVRISCRYSDNEYALFADARRELHDMLGEAGFAIETADPDPTPGRWVHELGTARMGRDPSTSVLNPFNRSWDVENLFVTDGSAFPTSGCQNPTLTMMALTVRACEHAVLGLRRGEY